MDVPHVSLDTASIDFRTTNVRSVSLTNHTHGKLVVAWMPCPAYFVVEPKTVEVGPTQTVLFQVTFKPRRNNLFYGNTLEAYAFYKAMRDYRLVDEKLISPAFCMTLTCTGLCVLLRVYYILFVCDTHR